MVWRLAAALLILATSAAGCASLPSNTGRTPSTAFSSPDETALGRLVQARRAQAGARAESGFRLLDSVETAFTSRLALIDGAQRSLDLQYYAIHADSSTEILLQHLRDAARRGVRVRVLMDDFNIVGTDAQVLRLAFEPNVQMRLFNPLPGSRDSLIGRLIGSVKDIGRIQKRMHNKLFLADNALGIAGGRNLGDAYFGADDKSNFVDLDVLAFGRVVRDMSASFDRYWNDELAYPVQALMSREDLEALRKKLDIAPQDDPSRSTPPQAPAALPVGAGASPTILPSVTTTAVFSAEQPMDLQRITLTWAPAVLMVDKPGKIGPGDDEVDAGDTVVDGLLTLMQQARQELLIISPYFVPGDEMMKVFAQLRAKGTRVRVLTNSLASNDAPAAHAGYARYRKDLLAMGVELYEMRAEQPGSASGFGSTPGFGGRSVAGSGPGGSKSGTSRASLHSKAVVIDRRLSIIGSMNLDLRSQLKNSEVALVIRSTGIAGEAARLIESSFARSAYRLELAQGKLHWRAPPGAAFKDATSEPEAGTKLRLLVDVLGPFAPDEML
jgi:putative cardiolipin synthase